MHSFVQLVASGAGWAALASCFCFRLPYSQWKLPENWNASWSSWFKIIMTTPSQVMTTQTGPSGEYVRLDMSWRHVSAINLKHLQQRDRHFFLQGLGHSLRPAAGSENWLVVIESVRYTVICRHDCMWFWLLPFRNHWTQPFSCCSFRLQPSVSFPSWWTGCPARPTLKFNLESTNTNERERYIYIYTVKYVIK